MKLVSPLRYSGGKSRLYKQIKQYLPKDKPLMVDLFFGGGSIGLNWLNDSQDNLLYANDINKDLINFWWLVKQKNKEEYFYLFENLINNKELTLHYFNNETTIFKEIRFLIVNKCSFNGIGKFSDLAFEQNFNESTFKRIYHCNKLLEQRSAIHNLDYKLAIKYWELQKEYRNDYFYYLDPPYLISNAKKIYKHGEINHEELANILKKINSKWVLSINDCKKIRELYKDFNIYEINAIYSMTNNGGRKSKRVKELIVTNFNKD